MTVFYVATLARYVLVGAATDAEARSLGRVALHDLHADVRERFGRDVPIDIRTVREASVEETELWRWHHDMLERETR